MRRIKSNNQKNKWSEHAGDVLKALNFGNPSKRVTIRLYGNTGKSIES